MTRQLTPVPTDGYVYDLSLASAGEAPAVAAWVQRDGRTEQVCWRVIRNDELGDVRSLRPVAGHATSPRHIAGRLIWCEMADGKGTLLEARLDDDLQPAGGPAAVAPLADANCGRVALAAGPSDALCMLAETWQPGGATLRLLRDDGDGWRIDEALDPPTDFAVRPRLARDHDAMWATWDQYSDGKYRTAVARLRPHGAADVELLPAPGEQWECLSDIAIAADGGVFVARCRERLVDYEGAAGHHSELVVAARDGDGWRDVAAIDIDFALNPWLAAYWGFRRFPILIPHGDGVWLAWEEKINLRSMGPGPGRLCGQFIAAAGPQGRPVVLVDYRCMFIVQRPPAGPRLHVATKTQWDGFEFHLPYELHSLDLAAEKLPRPDFLPGQAALPSFDVRPRGTDRAEMGDYKLFFGDPHVHSHLSCDVAGEPDELYHFARDVAGMDFVAFTENDATRFTEPLTPADWEHSRRLAETFNQPGRFTAFVAWEYTLHANPKFPTSYDSHRSVVFPGFDGRIVSWTDGAAPTTPDLAEAFRGERVLLHHHHAYGIDLTDHDLERNTELASGWMNRMRYPDAVEQIHAVLAGGHRLGFFAAGDVHERNPGLAGGLAGVWAESNTREAIFEAFRARRIFATTGLRPDLRFDVSGEFMGGEVTVTADPVVRVAVRCDVPVQRVDVIRDGQVIHTACADNTAVELERADTDCPPGEHYYYAHVVFAGETRALLGNVQPACGADAWTSCVWVRRN